MTKTWKVLLGSGHRFRRLALEAKLIIEHRIYTIQIGKTALFVDYFAKNGLEIQTKILGNLIGYFVSEIGKLNQVIQIWGYDSFAERERRRAELNASPEWLNYLKNAPPVIVDQENRILLPAPFSPIR